MTEHLSIPVTAAQAREWINDASDLAYPLRTPSTDEAINDAIGLICHLTHYLRQASYGTGRSVTFPTPESAGTWRVDFLLPQICADLGGLCAAFAERFEDFSGDESLRLNTPFTEGHHPDLTQVEAIGHAVAIANTYAKAAEQLRAVWELLSPVRISRITTKPVPSISEEGQR